MTRLSERKILLIHRDTRLDELIRRHNTKEQARFFVESRGDSFDDYEHEDRQLKVSLAIIDSALKKVGRVQLLERNFLPNFLFGPEDIVVVSGQDGLVANTLKYLNGQPLVAINPAPDLFDGQLLPFRSQDAEDILADVLRERRPSRRISFAEAVLNDGQHLLAVNDFYIGPKLPISARYELELSGKHEAQSSSGLLVSTGLGSTGWLRSVLTGAAAIGGGNAHADLRKEGMAWDSQELIYSVREPFPSRVTGTSMTFGHIQAGETLSITSQMAEGGLIFSDGIVADAIGFNSGMTARISLSAKIGQLVF